MATYQGKGFTVTELGLMPSLQGNSVQYYSSRCTITATGESQVFQWLGSGFPGWDLDAQGAATQKAFDYGRQQQQ
jgi:hypothetical protein